MKEAEITTSDSTGSGCAVYKKEEKPENEAEFKQQYMEYNLILAQSEENPLLSFSTDGAYSR